MIRGTVQTEFDLRRLLGKSNSAKAKMQMAFSEQVLKDSNNFAPERDGFLIGSGISQSNLSKGVIRWKTPYARRLYYNPQYNFSTDKNPMAGGLWFERAKKQKSKSWEDLVKRGYRQLF